MHTQPTPAPEQDENGLQAGNKPGSQSSSGMSTTVNDSLVDAFEREKQQRGEPLDVPADSLNAPRPPDE